MATKLQELRKLAGGIRDIAEQIKSGNTAAIQNPIDVLHAFSISAVYSTLHKLNLTKSGDFSGRPPSETLQAATDPLLKKQGLTLKQLYDMAAANNRHFAVIAWNNLQKNPAPTEADQNYMILHNALDNAGIYAGSEDMYALLKTTPITFIPIDHAHGLSHISRVIKNFGNEMSDFMVLATDPPGTPYDAAKAALNAPVPAFFQVEMDIDQIQRWSGLDDLTVESYLKAVSEARRAQEAHDFRLQ